MTLLEQETTYFKCCGERVIKWRAAEESTTFPADPPTRASSDIPTPKPPPDAAPRRRGITISHDEL